MSDALETACTRAIDFLNMIRILKHEIDENNAIGCVRTLGEIHLLKWRIQLDLRKEEFSDEEACILCRKVLDVVDLIQFGLAPVEKSMQVEDGYAFWKLYQGIWDFTGWMIERLEEMGIHTVKFENRRKLLALALLEQERMEDLLNAQGYYFDPITGQLEERK